MSLSRQPLIEPSAPILPSIDFGFWSDIPALRAALKINVLFLSGLPWRHCSSGLCERRAWGLIVRTAGESADAARAMGYRSISLEASRDHDRPASSPGSADRSLCRDLVLSGKLEPGSFERTRLYRRGAGNFARRDPMLCLWASLLFGGAAALGPALHPSA